MLTVAPHPLLCVAAFTTTFEAPLGATKTPESMLSLLRADARAPMQSNDEVRAAIRDLLRHGGYKPTGRGKPASEYLLRAAGEGTLSSINLAVDACNVVSLHSGLPISVVDLDQAKAPFSIDLAGPGARYVFNASGQEIDLEGLLCLFDAEGPCANAVKDAQRTKTSAATRRTLSVLWGAQALSERVREAASWYQSLLNGMGAVTGDCP